MESFKTVEAAAIINAKCNIRIKVGHYGPSVSFLWV